MIAFAFTLLIMAGFGVAVICFAGLNPNTVSVPPHRSTTRNAEVLYPFMSDAGYPAPGVYVGDSQFGGRPFALDLWTAYLAGLVTNTNIVIAGMIGRGKSTLVKTMVWRHLAFGRTSIIIDPKNEYGPLAAACGGVVISLAPGGDVTINPLDAATPQQAVEISVALAAASLERSLTPGEEQGVTIAVEAVMATIPTPTLSDVVAALYNPTEDAGRRAFTDPASLRASAEPAAAALWNLCQGPLKGMFDGPTNIPLDWAAPIIVLDLHEIAANNERLLGIVMAAALSWIRPLLYQDGKKLLCLDEAWFLLSDPALVLWLQSMMKLSRQLGISNILAVHKFDDLEQMDQSAAKVAARMLSDAETKILFALDATDAAVAQKHLLLNDTETARLHSLSRGECLFRVGDRSWLVDIQISDEETRLTDTDQAMRLEPVG